MKKALSVLAWLIPIIVSCLFGMPTLFEFLKSKSLVYTVEGSPILSLDGDMKSKIHFYVDSVPLKNPTYSVLVFENAGSIPIKSEDYQTPVTVSLDKYTPIIAAATIASEPEGIRFPINIDKNKFELPPVLFNPGDKVAIAVITDGYSLDGGTPEFKIQGRIVNIKSIGEKKVKKGLSASTIFYLILLTITTIYSCTVPSILKNEKEESIRTYVLVFVLLISFFVELACIIYGYTISINMGLISGAIVIIPSLTVYISRSIKKSKEKISDVKVANGTIEITDQRMENGR